MNLLWEFMGTNSKAAMVSIRQGPCRHHPLALKQAIFEETLQSAASIAQIARSKHAVNANQVFLWRKAYREGLLPEAKPTLLPVSSNWRWMNSKPARQNRPISPKSPQHVCTAHKDFLDRL